MLKWGFGGGRLDEEKELDVKRGNGTLGGQEDISAEFGFGFYYKGYPT